MKYWAYQGGQAVRLGAIAHHSPHKYTYCNVGLVQRRLGRNDASTCNIFVALDWLKGGRFHVKGSVALSHAEVEKTGWRDYYSTTEEVLETINNNEKRNVVRLAGFRGLNAQKMMAAVYAIQHLNCVSWSPRDYCGG